MLSHKYLGAYNKTKLSAMLETQNQQTIYSKFFHALFVILPRERKYFNRSGKEIL